MRRSGHASDLRATKLECIAASWSDPRAETLKERPTIKAVVREYSMRGGRASDLCATYPKITRSFVVDPQAENLKERPTTKAVVYIVRGRRVSDLRASKPKGIEASWSDDPRWNELKI